VVVFVIANSGGRVSIENVVRFTVDANPSGGTLVQVVLGLGVKESTAENTAKYLNSQTNLDTRIKIGANNKVFVPAYVCLFISVVFMQMQTVVSPPPPKKKGSYYYFAYLFTSSISPCRSISSVEDATKTEDSTAGVSLDFVYSQIPHNSLSSKNLELLSLGTQRYVLCHEFGWGADTSWWHRKGGELSDTLTTTFYIRTPVPPPMFLFLSCLLFRLHLALTDVAPS
jgi:hypothetical protein